MLPYKLPPARCGFLVAVFALIIPGMTASSNPHQPVNLTWVILDAYSEILNSTTSKQVPGSWFPDLYFDLESMLHITEASFYIKKQYFYVCPGYINTAAHRKTCGGVTDYFCASWSCVSTGHIYWNPPLKNDLIRVTRGSQAPPCGSGYSYDLGPPCNPVKISFTAKGKNYTKWYAGATWGARLYDAPRHKGNIFTVKLVATPVTPVIAVGPNKVLPPPSKISKTNDSILVDNSTAKPPSLIHPQPENPLWSVLRSTYEIVNVTHPEVTQSCWLCYNVLPPYYEAVGLVSKYNTSTDDASCRWKRGTQTLQALSGQGVCIGKVPTAYQSYCNSTNATINSSVFYIPPADGWWACSTGVTACAHGSVLNQTGFCILVTLMPRIFYHDNQAFLDTYSETPVLRRKREPLTALGIGLLFTLGLAGAGTGIGALTNSYTQYYNLRAAIDEDLARIENSISLLQASLTSLAEVALQNRRGMDLLFFQQGGLCIALKEECCFYADHSGVVHDSMAKLREGLNKRKAERESSQGWFEEWFNFSPWLTTLISALAGPLFLLIIACTIGPCILNRLIAFVKEKIGSLEAMVVHTVYNFEVHPETASLLPIQDDAEDYL